VAAAFVQQCIGACRSVAVPVTVTIGMRGGRSDWSRLGFKLGKPCVSSFALPVPTCQSQASLCFGASVAQGATSDASAVLYYGPGDTFGRGTAPTTVTITGSTL
jgi:hypothetical protein